MIQAWPQIWDDGQERIGTELHPDKIFSWAFTLFWSSLVRLLKHILATSWSDRDSAYCRGRGNKARDCKNQACGYLALIVFRSSICSLKGTENYICMQSVISASNQTSIGSWRCFPPLQKASSVLERGQNSSRTYPSPTKSRSSSW